MMKEFQSVYDNKGKNALETLIKEKNDTLKYQAENAEKFCTDLLEEAKDINNCL